MKMHTPYFIMATESGGSLVFLNQWHLQQFAAKTSRRLSGLTSIVQGSHADDRNSDEISIRGALDLMADMAWQLQQATAVLLDGPDQHQDQEWVEMEAGAAA